MTILTTRAGKASPLTNSEIDKNFTNLERSRRSRNFIINGGCAVAQRAAPNISAAFQYGAVDRIAARADGTPTAGTVSQATTSVAGRTAFACRVAGLSTGAGGAAYYRYRTESRDAKALKNQPAIVHCLVHHDVGISINYTITVNKANAVDDFTAVTLIAAPGNISVPNAAATRIELAIADMGDCSNGVEVIVKADCGAVVTKNFDLTEWQMELGDGTTPFDHRPIGETIALCQRYFEKSFNLATAPAQNAGTSTGEFSHTAATAGATIQRFALMSFKTPKRAAPTMVLFNPAVANAEARDETAAADCTATAAARITENSFSVNPTGAAGTAVGNRLGVHWTADSEL